MKIDELMSTMIGVILVATAILSLIYSIQQHTPSSDPLILIGIAWLLLRQNDAT